MNIGERLRERREAARLTLGQVSAYEDVTVQYLSQLEIGKRSPNVWPLLASLAQRYSTSADYILGLTSDPGPREVSPDEAVLLASIRALNKFDQVAVRTLLATLPKEAPEERRFTLEVITRILQPAKPQPHIIGEDPGDDMATSDESGQAGVA